MFLLSCEMGQRTKTLGGDTRNSKERLDVMVSRTHTSVVVCSHWSVYRPSRPLMGALSLKSAGSTKGAIAPSAKRPLIHGACPVSVCEPLICLVVLCCLISLPLSEPSLGTVETRSPIGTKIRPPERDRGSVLKPPRQGWQYLSFVPSRGSKDAPNNVDPLNGADASLHSHLESTCQFLSHIRRLAVTAEAMERTPNLVEVSVASTMNSAAATTLLNSL